MPTSADKHDQLLTLWNELGREKKIPVPQYERPSYGYCTSQVKRYAFKDEGGE